ncbi:MAG: ABC transporter ATP-binding protein [Desulfobacteraceae bacterium]|nr:ABC transporter ATP-binding protein [Desulfobacteraceae bacterium]
MKIEIEKISKSYQKLNKEEHIVLKDITFQIDKGDFVIILGESGCGKTTLLNMLAGFEKPTTGTIFADGKEIKGVHPSRSMLFQQPALIPWLTVEENVAYGCRIRGDVDNLDYRVMQFLEIMGLLGYSKEKPDALSLGMAHRTCLARALVGLPKVLLLDEPFAALDTFTQSHIHEELVNLWLSEQFSTVFVTHDIDEAIFLGTKIVLLGGEPASIQEIFELDGQYPRDKGSSSFKNIRNDILDRFKKSYIAKRILF